ncbi:hypothetical protein SADUNF_Sadunf06G0095000 [Salix dunnii]|uniref:Uncharacterized protein n=1 Tax=Salix dunnii TaxID=1413687 RepID=A0A835K6D9_9ROSI|nr:hypothetical protein SADUNF_Sadunf06G0095000 [Salix dunnii]
MENKGVEDEAAYDFEEHEVIEGDNGELLSHALVVRKLLLTPKRKEQTHTENIVSMNMVRKLGLKTEKHPSLYSIGWI